MSLPSHRHLHFPVHHASPTAFHVRRENISEKQTYTAYHKPIHSSSLYLIDSSGSSNGSKKTVHLETSARKLTRDYFELVASILMLGLPVPFFVLAFYAAHVNSKDIEENQWQSLQVYMKISVTAFPILFAATAGRALKKFASWRLEVGARIGHLEQLMGSTSLGGTIASIFGLRLCNTLAPTLLLMWAISPLGGQSSLHLITAGTRDVLSNVTVAYYDTRSESVFAQNAQSIDVYLPTTNAVFQASIMEPSAATTSMRDLWSNIKIPNLASVATAESLQSQGWTNITSEQDLTFSSLLGIPLSGLLQGGQTTMNLESSYLTLTQDDNPGNITNFDGWRFVNDTAISTTNGTWHWAFPSFARGLLMALDGFNAADGNYSIGYDIYDRYSPDTESESQATRRLALFSTNFDYGRIYRLSTTYVETQITCTGLPILCQPTAIRPSQQPHLNPNLTNLAYLDTWTAFANQMTSAVALLQTGVPTITEAYMNDPATVAATSVSLGTTIDHTTASDAALRLRAQQLLNTYWQASVNPALPIAGFSSATPNTSATPPLTTIRTRHTTGTRTSRIPIYVLNWAWWTAFTSATSSMFSLAVLALVMDCLIRGPEVLGSVAALLRDSAFVRTGAGSGSALGVAERTRAWGGVRVRLEDVRARERVGYIAVAEVGEGREDSLKLGEGARLYA